MSSPFRYRRPLILASSSPRRQTLLAGQGLDFQIIAPLLPEPKPLPGEDPASYALRAATAKAEEALAAYLSARPNALEDETARPLALAADTIVTLDTAEGVVILGKPVSAAHALDMLTRMAGRAHTVITACCLLPQGGPAELFADYARVTFAPWPEDVLRAYVATGDPLDKAGAYGIQGQGAFLAEKIEGSWCTVAGLPVHRVIASLLRMGAIAPRSLPPGDIT